LTKVGQRPGFWLKLLATGFWRRLGIARLLEYPEKTDRLEQRQAAGKTPSGLIVRCRLKDDRSSAFPVCFPSFIDPHPASPYHRDVKPVISSAQMREIDLKTTELFGVPSLALMENAAAAISRTAVELSGIADEPILVLCGPGNNGGDGASAARLLAQSGA